MNKKYKILYIDPPWHYSDRALAGNRGAECKYPILNDQQLKNLPIKSIMDENCAVFMWVTMPKLPIAFEVFNAWGLKYKTVAFNWVKKNKKANTYFFGMGNYTRSNSELCLLATKGKPKRISASVHQIIDSKIERHSKKPDIVRDKIVELMGDIPRIEIFGRQDISKTGWDVIGNEINGQDIIESLNDIIEKL